jgi:hypothetical protein
VIRTSKNRIDRFTPGANGENAFTPILNFNTSRKRRALMTRCPIVSDVYTAGDSYNNLMSRFLTNQYRGVGCDDWRREDIICGP